MKYIRELEGLRGIMALWVVLGHVLAALAPLFGSFPNNLYNSYPVQVFIILSGFVIFAMLDRGPQSYPRYIIGRAFRILPVYWVALLVSIISLPIVTEILHASPHGVATDGRIQIIEIAQSNLFFHILAHIPLLQGVLPTSVLPYASLTLVGQAWSLTVEWQFYLVAPLLFLMLTSLGRVSARIAVISITAACWIVSPYMESGFLGNNLPMFCAGFLSYFAFKNFLQKLSQQQLISVAALSIAFTLVFLRDFSAPLIIWIITFLSIVSAKFSGSSNVIGSILSTRFVTYLGRISYPLYMIHMQVLFASMWLSNTLELSESSRIVVIPVIGVVASIAAADIFHRIVEVPFHEFGRRISANPLTRRNGLDAA
jgi:peptidoglycan/LPS O-acetylase OafA/YrhL